MKVSQLLKVMDKEVEVIIYDYNYSLYKNIFNKAIFEGMIKDIHKDNPLNKAHIKYVLPFDNNLLIEITYEEDNSKK